MTGFTARILAGGRFNVFGIIAWLAPWLGGIAALEAVLFVVVSGYLKGPDSRLKLIQWLKSDRGTRLYERYVGGALRRVDRWLTPEDATNNPRPTDGEPFKQLDWLTDPHAPTRQEALRVGRDAFGWPVWDFALRLAVAYPFLFLFLQWGLSGSDGKLGPWIVLPASENTFQHGVTICGIVLLFALIIFRQWASANQRLRWVTVADWLFVAFAFAVAVVALLFTIIRLGADGRVSYAGFSIALLLVLFAIATIPLSDTARAWLVFLGVLPIANACFDYLSFGITRTLIRWGVATRNRLTIIYGLADLLAAFLLFTGLGCFTIAILAGMNSVAPEPLIDIQSTLQDIDVNRRNYWWLYLSFFSTLLPTFAHFALSTLCLIAYVPSTWRRGIRAMLCDKRHGGRREAFGPMLIALIGAFAIVGPILLTVGVGWLILSLFPSIGTAYLWFFAIFADWIGAPVDPVQVWPEYYKAIDV